VSIGRKPTESQGQKKSCSISKKEGKAKLLATSAIQSWAAAEALRTTITARAIATVYLRSATAIVAPGV